MAEQVLLQARSADPDSFETLRAVRLARALTTPTEARDELLTRWVGHPDRMVGRVVLERLAVAGPAPAALATVIDELLATDIAARGEGARGGRRHSMTSQGPLNQRQRASLRHRTGTTHCSGRSPMS